nr:MAG TPA_asm: hypothetical protein [Caudoviricetes sp.]
MRLPIKASSEKENRRSPLSESADRLPKSPFRA